MFGALIGDCIGSFWEFSGNKDTRIPLWIPAAHFTDDSVCTVAVADWLLDGTPLDQALRRRGMDHIDRGFGGRMRQWLMDDTMGSYQSWGNGSAMRVSAVALWAEDEDQLLELARASAMPTHDSDAGIRGAQATALAIRRTLEGHDLRATLREIETRFAYPGLVDIDPDQVRPGHVYDVSAQGTVPLALAIAGISQSFDHAMLMCCSMGGDADTLAAIAGPIVEARHGIAREHQDNARLRYAKTDLWDTIERLYAHPQVAQRLARWGKPCGNWIAQTTDGRVPPIRWKFKIQ